MWSSVNCSWWSVYPGCLSLLYTLMCVCLSTFKSIFHIMAIWWEYSLIHGAFPVHLTCNCYEMVQSDLKVLAPFMPWVQFCFDYKSLVLNWSKWSIVWKQSLLAMSPKVGETFRAILDLFSNSFIFITPRFSIELNRVSCSCSAVDVAVCLGNLFVRWFFPYSVLFIYLYNKNSTHYSTSGVMVYMCQI